LKGNEMQAEFFAAAHQNANFPHQIVIEIETLKAGTAFIFDRRGEQPDRKRAACYGLVNLG